MLQMMEPVLTLAHQVTELMRAPSFPCHIHGILNFLTYPMATCSTDTLVQARMHDHTRHPSQTQPLSPLQPTGQHPSVCPAAATLCPLQWSRKQSHTAIAQKQQQEEQRHEGGYCCG